MKLVSMKLLAGAAAAALLVAACGGDGGGSASEPQDTGGTTVASRITGTAATGAALPNAPVTITNSAGNSPCEETSISTDALGSYTCTLKTGEVAPFFIVVTDPSGNTGALVSVATTTPAAGTPLTVNATPLTTAIVAQLSADGNPLSLVSSKTIDAAALKTVTANIVAQLAPVLSAIGVPAGYDPFATAITAATPNSAGNTADLVLDVIKVVTDPATSQLAFTTINDPTPVVMATASSTGATVPAPDASVSTLSVAAQLVAKTLTSCFALPTSTRVLDTDTTVPQAQGGPEVLSVDPVCENIVVDGKVPDLEFLHNGYNGGQFFYGLLTSDGMTGASFSVPEILAFYPKVANSTGPDQYDRAVVNIRYVDNQGNPGSVTTSVSRIPGTSTTARPTEWWLVGNQQRVDIGLRLNLRRVEQLNPSTTTGTPSQFQTGAVFNINSKGPGSVLNGQNLTMARVTGPGLTTGGLVYRVSAGTQNAMDMWNKTGSLTAGSLCGNNGNTVNCPNLWLERTAGITGSAATTLRANPANGTNALIWAQPNDGFDASKFVNGARYKVELFYGTNTGTADRVIFKTLLTSLVAATEAVNLPWNGAGPQTLAALDPAGALAGAQTALTVDWVQNPAAPQIGGIAANIVGASFGPSTPVRRGATSATYQGGTVPAFTTSSNRNILLSYRSSDSSNRSSVYAYN